MRTHRTCVRIYNTANGLLLSLLQSIWRPGHGWTKRRCGSTFANQAEPKTITMRDDYHERLRKQAFEQNTAMSFLIEEALKSSGVSSQLNLISDTRAGSYEPCLTFVATRLFSLSPSSPPSSDAFSPARCRPALPWAAGLLLLATSRLRIQV